MVSVVHDGEITLNLANKSLHSVPTQLVSEYIQRPREHHDRRPDWSKVTRLSLTHNRLASLPDNLLQLLPNVKYLNLKANQFSLIPDCVKNANINKSHLEILDMSRNWVVEFPQEVGGLKRLKVLSLSRNRIERLPQYLGQMDNLHVLKVDHNPLIWPPGDIAIEDGEHEVWLAKLKDFMRSRDAGDEAVSYDVSEASRTYTQHEEPRLNEESRQIIAAEQRKEYRRRTELKRQLEHAKQQIRRLQQGTLVSHSDIQLIEDARLKLDHHLQNMLRDSDTGPLLGVEVYRSVACACVGVVECARVVLDTCATMDANIEKSLGNLTSLANEKSCRLIGCLDEPQFRVDVVKEASYDAILITRDLIQAVRQHARLIASHIDIRYGKKLIMDWFLVAVEFRDAHDFLMGAQFNPYQTGNLTPSAASSQASSRVITPTRSVQQQHDTLALPKRRFFSTSASSGSSSTSSLSTMTSTTSASILTLADNAVNAALYVVSQIEKSLGKEAQEKRSTAAIQSIQHHLTSTDQAVRALAKTLSQYQARPSDVNIIKQFQVDANGFVRAITIFSGACKNAARDGIIGKDRNTMTGLQTLTRVTKNLALQLKLSADETQ